MRRAAWVLAAVAVAAVVVIGLLQASGDAPETARSSYDHEAALASLKAAPAPLAALHRQESELVDGGADALRDRLDALRGYPVVINKWGSWCPPCQREFPVFQEVSASKGKTVAFLGIDGADPTEDAEAFLAEFPVSYPSYVDDGREDVAEVVEAAGPFPQTAFVRADGEVEIVVAKEYRTVAELEADIEKYLGA